MDNLDLLIAKFKEAKDELQKGITTDDAARAASGNVNHLTKKEDKDKTDQDARWEEKMKAFHKAESMEKMGFGVQETPKPGGGVVIPPAPSTPRLTGSARIAAAGQQAIQPTSVGSRALMQQRMAQRDALASAPPQATGSERIAQVAARPIQPFTSPARGAAPSAASVPSNPYPVRPESTGSERIKRFGTAQPLMRSEGKERLTFSKGGQWNLKDMEKGVNTLGGAGTPDDSI